MSLFDETFLFLFPFPWERVEEAETRYAAFPSYRSILSPKSSGAPVNPGLSFSCFILHKPASCFHHAIILLLERLEDGHRGNRLHCG
ncbi:MAG: hypothetical protein QXN75_06660 [Thermoproteota archaeon]|nr:hypothetical protein [Candidatus Brockarchaeota archaeon]